MMQNNMNQQPALKVRNNININNIQGPNNPRYKTSLCKHFDTPQGCSYGEKCQFAHGSSELRINNPQGFHMMPNNPSKIQNSLYNYKIVKCKNFEKDGTCKYGDHCTFAHGDKDLRSKTENMYSMNPNPMFMMPMVMDMPFMMPPQGMDMNQLQQMMMQQGNMPPNMIMGNPMMMANPQDMMNNNDNNHENKGENQQ